MSMSEKNKYKYKVSICIPAYKQPEFLRRTLQSVFIQTFEDYEIVISDDSPDDSVEKIVAEFLPDSKIVYSRNKVRKGSPENWNAAIYLSCGEYIKILHHDDYFSQKESLYNFVKMLDEHPDSDFAFSGNIITDINQNALYCHSATVEQAARMKKDPKYLFFGNYIGSPSSTIFRNSVQEQFDTNLKWVVDIDFYIAVLQKNVHFVYVSDPLLCCSLGVPGQLTSECAGNKSIELFEWLYLYKKIDDKPFPNYSRLLFIWNLLKKNEIRSTDDFLRCGVNLRLPSIIRIFLPFRTINYRAAAFMSSAVNILKQAFK